MNKVLMIKWVQLVAGVALCLMLTCANAVPVSWNFQIDINEGPLAVDTQPGSYTYDDSVIPVGGGFVNAVGLFTDLGLTVGGTLYDENTANSGCLNFDSLGNLLDAHFGSNCSAGSCSIGSGSGDRWVRVGPQSVNDFVYSVAGTGGIWPDNTATLPGQGLEPTSLALLGLGLFGLGLKRRKSLS